MTRRDQEDLIGVLASLLTFAVGGAIVAALAGDTIVPVAAVLAIAFVKARFVIFDFLELRDSRSLLRTALVAWPCILLAAAFARAVAVALI